METPASELVTSDADAENITDIQNYLQSFNKEIGEAAADGQTGAAAGATFYLDASQLTTSGGGAAGSNVVQTTIAGAASGDGNFQTVAIVPNDSGGYVLIVQPPTGGDGTQVQIPQTAILEQKEVDDIPTPAPAKKGRAARSSRIKKEVVDPDADKPNDISVYDFDDINPPAAAGVEEDGIGMNVDADIYEEEEEAASDQETKPASTPKKRQKKSTGGSTTGKKAKPAPSTPSSSTVTQSASGNTHHCNYCTYTSNKRYLLSRHMKSHSEERPHKCGICERGFKTIASLQNHVNTHTGVRPHGCKYCEAAFTTSGELVRHVRYRHTHEKPHRCTECDYASVELSKLKRHMRCHTGERPYQCPHCTYASPDTYKLKRHLRIHTGEKPYECDVCHARFTQSNSLKAHRLIHSGNKPIFKCELCPTTCGRKTDLRIHVQKLHTSERPMTCRRCDQCFPDRYTFKLHQKSHEGEKCFKCDLCNYSSVSQRHLESHMLIHTDQKPFNCDECDQSFRQKQLLKRHKNLYHNPNYVAPAPKEKTHECPHCNKSFRHKGNLMRHLVIHDPDSYKDSNTTLRFNEDMTLIDDEEEEEEETDEEEEDEDDSQVMAGNPEDESLDQQTLSFTLDAQTLSGLSGGGDQVVVFEVVQMGTQDTEGGESAQIFEAQTTDQLTTPVKKVTRRGKSQRSAIISNGASTSTDNIIILQTEDEEAAGTITGCIIDDPDYDPGSLGRKLGKMINSNNQSSIPAPVIPEDNKSFMEEIRKKKDMMDCFGFKDDDDEDDAILSMPATAAQ